MNFQRINRLLSSLNISYRSPSIILPYETSSFFSYASNRPAILQSTSHLGLGGSLLCRVIASKVWELMAFACGCFPPTEPFISYIIAHIRKGTEQENQLGKLAVECMTRLLTVLENGIIRKCAPSILEINAVRVRKHHNYLRFFFERRHVNCKRIGS